MNVIKNVNSTVKPLELDTESSPTTVYIRKNIKFEQQSISGLEINMYVYDEYQYTQQEYCLLVADQARKQMAENIKQKEQFEKEKQEYQRQLQVCQSSISELSMMLMTSKIPQMPPMAPSGKTKEEPSASPSGKESVPKQPTESDHATASLETH